MFVYIGAKLCQQLIRLYACTSRFITKSCTHWILKKLYKERIIIIIACMQHAWHLVCWMMILFSCAVYTDPLHWFNWCSFSILGSSLQPLSVHGIDSSKKSQYCDWNMWSVCLQVWHKQWRWASWWGLTEVWVKRHCLLGACSLTGNAALRNLSIAAALLEVRSTEC